MKKHSFKKILALLIAILMVIPAIPVVASADDSGTAATKETVEIPLGVDNLTADNPYVTDGVVDFTAWLADVNSSKTITLDSKDDLIIFMLWGSQTTEKVADISQHFSGYTINLTTHVTLNKGDATADGFVPDDSQLINDGENKGKYAVYTWTPWYNFTIPSDKDPEWYGFRGTFNGSAKTISGLVIDEGDSTLPVGFFRHLGQSATVKSIRFSNAYVKGNTSVGVIAGRTNNNHTTKKININYSHISGVVIGNGNVGGFVGENTAINLTMSNPFVNAPTTIINAGDNTGSILGVSSTAIKIQIPQVNCTIEGAKNIGGLVGSITATSTSDKFVTGGNVTCTITGAENVGGLVGVTTMPIENAIHTYSGGKTESTTINCNITATGNFVGGAVGRAKAATTLSQIEVTGSVTGVRFVSAVVGATNSNLTVDNARVVADVGKSVGMSIGGFLGGPYNGDGHEVTTTVSINNASFEGTVTGTYAVGGFIGRTGSTTVAISNSVCYASEITGGETTGGFIGAAESNITFTNCHYLGAEQFDASGKGAFVTIADFQPKSWLPQYDTTATGTITFIDCYREKHSTYAIGFKHGHGYDRFDLAYTYGETTTTVDLAKDVTVTEKTEGDTTTYSIGYQQYQNIQESMNSYVATNGSATSPVAIEGVQMGTDNNARIVASIVSKEDIHGIDFEVIKLGTMATDATQFSTEHVANAYTSIKNDFGLSTLVAGEGELTGAEYIATLALCGINTDTDAAEDSEVHVAETIFVRARVSIDNEDGSISVVYSNYMAITFCNGRVLGLGHVYDPAE